MRGKDGDMILLARLSWKGAPGSKDRSSNTGYASTPHPSSIKVRLLRESCRRRLAEVTFDVTKAAVEKYDSDTIGLELAGV